MRLSTVALALGGATALIAEYAGSIWLFFAGALVGGVGFGAAFQASLKLLLPLAHPHERAGLLSVVYTVSYLALGLPAVIAGWLVVHEGGLLQTAREYSIFVIALGVLAFVGLVVSARARSSRGSTTEGAEKLVMQ
jgi:MFS family permease